MVIAVTGERGHVVGPQDAFEADIPVGAEAFHHVGRAVVVERFLIFFYMTAYIPEMYEMGFTLVAEMANGSRLVVR